MFIDFLRFLYDIGLVNHPAKLDAKIICTLETDLTKPFKSNIKFANTGVSNTKIIWHNTPSFKYEQFRLNNDFRHNLEACFHTKSFLNGHKKTPLQKSFKLGADVQSYLVDFVQAVLQKMFQ